MPFVGPSVPRVVPDDVLVVHDSHNMRKFSDIEWGCWSCGSCVCHHQEQLRQPCTKSIKRKNEENSR